jgi:hypothetical protein
LEDLSFEGRPNDGRREVFLSITHKMSEIIVVNPFRDQRLARVLDYVIHHASKYAMGKERIEFLLKVIRNTLGPYGSPKGPSSQQADEALYHKMKQ